MESFIADTYKKIYVNCHRILGAPSWGRILDTLLEDSNPKAFPDTLQQLKSDFRLPDYIMDLARVELVMHQTREHPAAIRRENDALTVNPTLTLTPVSWKNLVALINQDLDGDTEPQEAAGIYIMTWQHPKTGALLIRESEDIDLLALKIVAEKIEPKKAASIGGVTLGAIEAAGRWGINQGLILSPESKIRRKPVLRSDQSDLLGPYLAADIFTLQWHITQECDLHCKHCYDRDKRVALPYDMAVAILDDFYLFCQEMHVRGQVTFTGGNPLLYPHFIKIYKEAADRGFGLALLGNPTPIQQIEKLLNHGKPLYFQISLEGLENHNDYIRGKGHFKRSLKFLDQLRSLNIYSMVMLTLSRDNIQQVLPLADLLKERTDYFTFNRLSTVGEGAQMMMADPGEFQTFLRAYEAAATQNPIMGLKDNLFNIIRKEDGREIIGGCTGYGCGAAFNFMAVLPEGEVHACRKFPSPIGDVTQSSLNEIYHSQLAEKYRNGGLACGDCSLNLVCRGCLAIVHSCGLDVFQDKDPFCFVDDDLGAK